MTGMKLTPPVPKAREAAASRPFPKLLAPLRSLTRLSIGSAMALVALLAFVSEGVAANQIVSVSVSSETSNQVRLLVTYDYSGDHGNNVFMSAVMANGGQPSPHYAHRPGRVQPGRHRTEVSLSTNQSAPAWFATTQLRVQMYAGGGNAFVTKFFQFPKSWTRAGASLPAEAMTQMTIMQGVQPQLQLAEPGLTVVDPQGPAPGGQSPDKVVIMRVVLPGGVVEIHYSDGHKKRLFQGGYDIISPTGQVSPARFASSQPPTPPSAPPDTQHAKWLEAENTRLLNILKGLVANDEASINNYLNEEGPGSSYYVQIDSRTEAIGYLVSS